jgi:hypothetical protein
MGRGFGRRWMSLALCQPPAAKDGQGRGRNLNRRRHRFALPQAGDFGPDFGQFIDKGKAGQGHLDAPSFHALSIALKSENFAKGTP